MLFLAEILEVLFVETHRDGLGLTWFEPDFSKSFQLFQRTWFGRLGIGDIELYDFRTGPFSGIRYRNTGFDFCRPFVGDIDLQIAIGKRGIRKPVTEREEWFHTLMFVSAVAHKNPFTIIDFTLTAGFIVISGRRTVCPTAFDSKRQFGRRIDPSGKDMSQSMAAFLTRIEGMQDSRNPVDPLRHIHATTGMKYHHQIRIYLQEFADQTVLSVRQVERPVASFEFDTAVQSGAEHHDIGSSGQTFRFGKIQVAIVAVTHPDFCRCGPSVPELQTYGQGFATGSGQSRLTKGERLGIGSIQHQASVQIQAIGTLGIDKETQTVGVLHIDKTFPNGLVIVAQPAFVVRTAPPFKIHLSVNPLQNKRMLLLVANPAIAGLQSRTAVLRTETAGSKQTAFEAVGDSFVVINFGFGKFIRNALQVVHDIPGMHTRTAATAINDAVRREHPVVDQCRIGCRPDDGNLFRRFQRQQSVIFQKDYALLGCF